MRRFVLIAIVAALAGCATQQPTGPSMAELLAADPSDACGKTVIAEYASGPLGGKITFGAAPTLEMLADKSTIDVGQKAALNSYAAARQQCIDAGRQYRQSALPGQVTATLEDGFASLSTLMAKLYAGDMTFGEFNTARVENARKASARLVEYDQQARRAQADANAADAARRQAAGLAALQAMQAQQAIQAQQPIYYQPPVLPTFRTPTTTNCQRWGNQVSCTTN